MRCCVIGPGGLESKELDSSHFVARLTTTKLNRCDESRRQPLVEVALLKPKRYKATLYYTKTTRA